MKQSRQQVWRCLRKMFQSPCKANIKQQTPKRAHDQTTYILTCQRETEVCPIRTCGRFMDNLQPAIMDVMWVCNHANVMLTHSCCTLEQHAALFVKLLENMSLQDHVSNVCFVIRLKPNRQEEFERVLMRTSGSA